MDEIIGLFNCEAQQRGRGRIFVEREGTTAAYVPQRTVLVLGRNEFS